MPKNLVVFHLESISNIILWQYRLELATIWRLMGASERYTRYHSSATSTGMVLYHLFWGNSFIGDGRCRYSDKSAFPYLNREMGARLRDFAGYDPHYLYLDYFYMRTKTDGYWHYFKSPGNLFDHARSYLREMAAAKKPFVVLFYSEVTHMALQDAHKAQAQTFSDRFVRSYKELDAWINAFLGLLAEFNLLNDTVVAGYGDHGDELWSHGLNRGYCHCIAPYGGLTWTPFFVYEEGVPARDNPVLASTVDVAPTLIRRLTPEYVLDAKYAKNGEAPFCGINLAREKREFAFSQALYALQQEYADPEKGLKKGYSITDGDYRLVVSTDKDRKKDGGLEFYHDRLDPFNSRNLLDFFILGSGGNILAFRPPSGTEGTEFGIVFNPAAVKELTQTYEKLRNELYAYVREKEKTAMAIRSADNYQIMPEKSFTFAKKPRRSL